MGIYNPRPRGTSGSSSSPSGSFTGTISAEQIAYGTAADTLGGEDNLTYDSTNKVLKINQPTNIETWIELCGPVASWEFKRSFGTLKIFGGTDWLSFNQSTAEIVIDNLHDLHVESNTKLEGTLQTVPLSGGLDKRFLGVDADGYLIEIVDELGTGTQNITANQSIVPSVSGVYDLGSTEKPWKTGYFTENSIYLGGTKVSVDGGTLKVNDSDVGGGGGGVSGIVEKTTDYTLTSSEAESNVFVLNGGASANVTFTIDSMGESDDGTIFYVLNNSDYNLTLAVSDNDYIEPSGPGYGLELPNQGSYVEVQYDHTNTKFVVLGKKGLVTIEGLELCLMGDNIYPDKAPDATGKHLVDFSNVSVVEDGKFGGGAYYFNGTDEYISIPYNERLNIHRQDMVEANTGPITMSFWINIVNVSGQNGILQMREDSSNYWNLHNGPNDTIKFQSAESGINRLTPETPHYAVDDNTWHHVVMFMPGRRGTGYAGLYVDGILYDDLLSNTGFGIDLTAPLEIGRVSTDYNEFKICDFYIAYNDPYYIQEGRDDAYDKPTITVPSQRFRGVL